jgi:hypothetical protein
MGWSAQSIFCGNDFFGFVYRSFGGSLTEADCGKLQTKAGARAINVPGSPYVSNLSCDGILALADSAGFVSTGPDTGSHQCVALVKAGIPALGPTGQWQKGDDIDPARLGDLQPGTAIGYGFDSSGNYPSHATGNHAAIVAHITRDSLSVLDQWDRGTAKQPAKIHFINPSLRKWSIITRKGVAVEVA